MWKMCIKHGSFYFLIIFTIVLCSSLAVQGRRYNSCLHSSQNRRPSTTTSTTTAKSVETPPVENQQAVSGGTKDTDESSGGAPPLVNIDKRFNTESITNEKQTAENAAILTENTESTLDYSNKYYNVTRNPGLGQLYWNELASPERLNQSKVYELSRKRAVTLQLLFAFPFHGEHVRAVTVTKGGFIYTGNFLDKWPADTQYIAPFLADFNTKLSGDVNFYDNGTAFTVIWENMYLRNGSANSSFTFLATLYDSGDIIFVYNSTHILEENPDDLEHVIKIGLSDAYVLDTNSETESTGHAGKKAVEYNRLQYRQDELKNWTTLYFKAKPNCVVFTDCETCTKQSTEFVCEWCPAANRCSSGFDRHRQEWIDKDCHLSTTPIRATDQCPGSGSRDSKTSETSEPPLDTSNANGDSSTPAPTQKQEIETTETQ